ncbi:MAG: hypothetical protein AAFV93_19810 [Chloroflexota bacterium]
MDFSSAAQTMIAITLITIPTIEFGGYFLLSQLPKRDVIQSDFQAAFFRAGHAHAGVLVLLVLLAQIFIDVLAWNNTALWTLRIGFFASPLLVSGGFFFSAMTDPEKPNGLIVLIYIGAIVLAISLLALGIGLLFAL